MQQRNCLRSFAISCRMCCSCAVVLMGLGLVSAARDVIAGDWPQILGPQRSGIADGEKLAVEYPGGQPGQLWEATIGSGFAGVAVSGESAVLFHRVGDNDTVTAFETSSGKKLWDQGFKTDFLPNIVPDNGPRAIPTIHDGKVYAFAPNGGLYCVDLKTGDTKWQRQTHQDYHAPAGYFGAGSSPLVEGKAVIVNVGGDRDDAGVVAFDLHTGKTIWKSTRDQASYSSPIAATLDGTRHLLCVTRLNFVSLDPVTGAERFRTPFGKRGPTVNAAIPVLMKNQVLLTASYEIGAELLTLHKDRVEVKWEDEVLSSQYTTPILHEGTIYGVDGRQDGGPIKLVCFDPQSRKLYWSNPLSAYATLIAADGKLIVMQTDGIVKLVALNKAEYREIAAARLISGTTRALPALADGRFYVRNENLLRCVKLGR